MENMLTNPDISKILHCLGSVVEQKGDFSEALKWCNQSLKMDKRIHGNNANHTSIAASLHFLGNVAAAKCE